MLCVCIIRYPVGNSFARQSCSQISTQEGAHSVALSYIHFILRGQFSHFPFLDILLTLFPPQRLSVPLTDHFPNMEKELLKFAVLRLVLVQRFYQGRAGISKP